MKKFILGAIIATGLAGCYNDKFEELYPPSSGCDSTNINYTNHLKSIVDSRCATSGCHLGQVPTGWDLSTYSGLKAVADNGKLLPSIMHTGPSPMPKGLPKLDDCTIAKFANWVNNNEPQ